MESTIRGALKWKKVSKPVSTKIRAMRPVGQERRGGGGGGM